ncbi:transposase, partial [Acinetobacter baumannii]
MPRTMLTDQNRQKLKVILRNLSIHHNSNIRNYIEDILYRIRTGSPWRQIPSCIGHSNSIIKRKNRRTSSGKNLRK